MDAKTFFGYWKESLGWLRWSELKLLLLVTLNNFVRSLKLLIKYFGWLLLINVWLLYLVIKPVSPYFFDADVLDYTVFNFSKLGWLKILAVSTNILIFFFYCLIARAALEKKDWNYFFKYLKKLPWFFTFWLLGGKWLPMVMFFFLDAGNHVSDFFVSLKRGILLELYFLPGLLLGGTVVALGGTLLGLGFFIASWSLPGCLPLFYGLGLVTLMLTMMAIHSFRAIMYSKIKHSHYQLFFK